MPTTKSGRFVSIESRHSDPHEIKELEEFVAAAAEDDLDFFVERIYYDSKSCTCYFEFRMGLQEDEEAAHQLRKIARATISQFEWFGSIDHGRGVNDE